MRKVNNLQLSTIEKQMAFYDFSSFDAENKVVIYFRRDQFFLADPGYHVNGKVFYQELSCIQLFIAKLMDKIADQECIIRKYQDEWVKNKRRSRKLHKSLKQAHIQIRKTPAIEIHKKSSVIPLFVESIVKYNTFAEFIFAEEKIVLSPTDHMDVFICFENAEVLDKVEKT